MFAGLLLFVALTIACGGSAIDAEGQLEGTLERTAQSYPCDQIGQPCVGASGNSGTIQQCIHVDDKCCCQTSAGLELLGRKDRLEQSQVLE